MKTYLLCLVILCSSCATLQKGSRLSDHKRQLNSAAKMIEDPNKQVAILMKSLTTMMSESLDFLDPQKGLKFVNKYKDQNEKSIQAIISNLETWMGAMAPAEKVATVLGLVKEENVQEFITLVPKFEKKYKQIQFFSKISNKFKGLFFGS